MTESNEPRKPIQAQSRVKQKQSPTLRLTLIIVIAISLGFYFYVSKSPAPGYNESSIAGTSSNSTTQTLNSPAASKQNSTSDSDAVSGGGSQAGSHNAHVQGLVTDGQNDSGTTESTQALNPLAEDLGPDETSQQKHIDQLNSFYSYLDNQPYMQNFKLGEPSRDHFTRLIQKLLDNPPVVARETDDLFTLLQNTAHFFRILGKENILILKGILDREKDSLEEMFDAFFILTAHPQILKNEYQLELKSDALYDYAVFLINTMGGRLYLFRRDSSSRMAVTYYAIQVIDRAISEGNSRHGIDIRPAINSLTEELENGGNRLKYREQYLDRLYDLQEKYN